MWWSWTWPERAEGGRSRLARHSSSLSHMGTPEKSESPRSKDRAWWSCKKGGHKQREAEDSATPATDQRLASTSRLTMRRHIPSQVVVGSISDPEKTNQARQEPNRLFLSSAKCRLGNVVRPARSSLARLLALRSLCLQLALSSPSLALSRCRPPSLPYEGR